MQAIRLLAFPVCSIARVVSCSPNVFSNSVSVKHTFHRFGLRNLWFYLTVPVCVEAVTVVYPQSLVQFGYHLLVNAHLHLVQSAKETEPSYLSICFCQYHNVFVFSYYFVRGGGFAPPTPKASALRCCFRRHRFIAFTRGILFPLAYMVLSCYRIILIRFSGKHALTRQAVLALSHLSRRSLHSSNVPPMQLNSSPSVCL